MKERSVPLSNWNREMIVRMWLNDEVEPKIEKLGLAAAKQALRSYKELMPRGFPKTAKDHPDWFVSLGQMKLSNGSGIRDNVDVKLVNAVPFPTIFVGKTIFKDDIPKTYDATMAAYNEWKNAHSVKRKLEHSIELKLKAFRTSKQLIEGWPEGKKYLVEVVDLSPKTLALAVRMDDVAAEVAAFPAPAKSAANEKGAGRLLRQQKQAKEKA